MPPPVHEPDPALVVPTNERRPIAGDSLRRLAAELIGVVLAFATGVMTARQLGPGAKGTLSELSFLSAAGAVAAGLGLGEAGVVLLARRRRSLAQIVHASTTVVLAAGAVVGGVVVLVGWLQFQSDWGDLRWSIVLAGVIVPVLAGVAVLGALLESQGRFTTSSVARVAMTAVTVGATWLFVVRWSRDLPGALLALLLGDGLALILLFVALLRERVVVRPGWDRAYATEAFRFGFPVQLSSLVMVLTTRIDLLVVDHVRGAIAAGHYSVALTLGALCTYGPFALSVAAYPRAAGLGTDEADRFTARVCRTSVLAGIVGAVLLTPVILVATPIAFGPGFRASVAPAVVLLLGGVCWSAQWPLCRLRAARGDGRLLLRSFTVNMVVMLVVDVPLVHLFGVGGAAVGSVLGAAAGVAVALHPNVDWRTPSTVAELLVPRPGDVRELLRWLPVGRATSAGGPPAG